MLPHILESNSYLFHYSRLSCVPTNGLWPKTIKNCKNLIKKKPNSYKQSVKIRRLVCLSKGGGGAFWLFESRIGWGSFKLPNNSAAYHRVPIKSGSHNRLDADPSPDWVTSWNKCSCETNINSAELTAIRGGKNKLWMSETGAEFDLPSKRKQ